MKIKILTLFPSMFDGFKSESIIKRSIEKGVVDIEIIDFREWSKDKHHKVDDTPYGGGAGMVINPTVIYDCLEDVKTPLSHIILMTPQGSLYNQEKANSLARNYEELIFICGHYEGFDERIRSLVDEEISIGDFVLTGGELPSMVISDSIIRLLDGAINEDSYLGDSHQNNLLEYPQYTRPEVFNGLEVPFVLRNGNHKEIRKWRIKESLRRTRDRRPDLLSKHNFTDEEKEIYEDLEKEKTNN
jgi:tRNA (guanine37-N1)-methyltransferase